MNLLRAAATVSGLTLLSRVTGLVRENIMATVFGASALTDAFFVAFRLPNLLRRLFAEGAFSQAFVPMLAAHRGSGEGPPDESTRNFISAAAGALAWALLLVCTAGVVGAPLLVWLMASGLAADADTLQAATTMTRWMFPYILLISLVSLSAGILNTWRHFAVPAATPMLLNLAMIGAALGLSSHFDPPVFALAAGVMIGGVLQLAIQIPPLVRLGLLPRPSLSPLRAFADPKVRQLLARMAPAVLAVSVAQVSLVINTHIASRLAAGSVSWVTYADRLMEFPTALLGVALGTVLLPSLSRAGESHDARRYSELLDWGLRLCLVFAVPCMLGLMLMAQPLTALLYHYGRFSAGDVHMTSLAVSAYGSGLLGLIAIKVLAPGFYARQDIRTPVKIALWVLLITQGLNLVFVPVLQHAGLALAISVGAWLNAGLLLAGLLRGAAYQPARGWASFALKILVAASAMGLLLAMAVPRFDWIALQAQPVLRAALVLGVVAAAAGVYLLALAMLGLRPRQFLRKD